MCCGGSQASESQDRVVPRAVEQMIILALEEWRVLLCSECTVVLEWIAAINYNHPTSHIWCMWNVYRTLLRSHVLSCANVTVHLYLNTRRQFCVDSVHGIIHEFYHIHSLFVGAPIKVTLCVWRAYKYSVNKSVNSFLWHCWIVLCGKIA